MECGGAVVGVPLQRAPCCCFPPAAAKPLPPPPPNRHADAETCSTARAPRPSLLKAMRRDVRILLVGDGELCHPRTDSRWALLLIAPSRRPRRHRGCRQEHDRHVVHQGGVCTTRKSSLHSYSSPLDRVCSSQVQHVVPEVTIPPEVTPENVTTYIVDTGCAYDQHCILLEDN